ncbi:GNAT family N-acetyltransferase [Sciscionella sediminilitoris]|uniref:GNAT family N-acetyltransferase n=1 Tax=Sciscionella sediminilitoris TaxID=1445613 RepID=UPI0004DF9383|nr:GNAT family N-acetyltransferase [Sciscionella sp. SE31]
MADYSIRLAEPAEYPAVGELTLEAYAADGFDAPEADYAAVLLDAADRARAAELYVAAEADGTLLGTATYCAGPSANSAGSSYAEIAGPGEADLRMLGVTPAARGRGIGEALVRHALRRAGEQGLDALVLSSAEYMHAAHRLYDRIGFSHVPERDWRPIPSVLLHVYRAEPAPVR